MGYLKSIVSKQGSFWIILYSMGTDHRQPCEVTCSCLFLRERQKERDKQKDRQTTHQREKRPRQGESERKEEELDIGTIKSNTERCKILLNSETPTETQENGKKSYIYSLSSNIININLQILTKWGRHYIEIN